MQVPILPRVARGESNAIDECLDRYGGLVWSLACRLSPTTVDAEDAVQEIFIDLWRNAGRYRQDAGAEATFVSVLARRRLVDRLRRGQRAPQSQPLDESNVEHVSPAIHSHADLEDDAKRAAACLEKLRNREREAIELSVYEGFTQSRIAQRLGSPLGTVKTLIRRGLSQLRACMQVDRGPQAKGVAPS